MALTRAQGYVILFQPLPEFVFMIVKCGDIHNAILLSISHRAGTSSSRSSL